MSRRLRPVDRRVLPILAVAMAAVAMGLLRVPVLGVEPPTLAAGGAVTAALATLYHRWGGADGD